MLHSHTHLTVSRYRDMLSHKGGAFICQFYHVHAIYGEDVAEVAIKTREVLDGHLPPKALSMVREWIEINQTDLLSIWDTQEFRSLNPLE